MSNIYVENPAGIQHAPPLVQRVDDGRGTFGMWLFILTESTLFTVLFFSYYYIEKGDPQRWTYEKPPHLHLALPMLGVLLLSSLVLHWGEQNVKKERYGAGMLGLIGTVALGVVFLVLTYFEYAESLGEVRPDTDAYGSIFYTIISFHGAHLLLGLLVLVWVGILHRWEPRVQPPYRPYHNAAMYWHFVDLVWLFVVAILYVGPNIYAKL